MSQDLDGATSVPQIPVGEVAHRRILLLAGRLTLFAALFLIITQAIQELVPALPSPPFRDLVANLALVAIGGVVAWLAGRGQVRAASIIVIVSMLLIACFQLYTEGHPSQDLTGAFLLLFTSVLGGVLLGRRAAWAAFAAGSALYLGMLVLWLGGKLPAPPTRPSMTVALFAMLGWLACGVAMVSVVRLALTSLQQQAAELERRVADRTVELERARGSLEVLVKQRTAELQAANTQLRDEMAERERTALALQESERVQRAVVDAIPDMLAAIDSEGTYTYLRPARDWAPLGDPEAYVGKNIRDLLPQEMAERRLAAARRAQETGLAEEYEYQIEHDGHIRHYETRIVPSGPDQTFAIVRDVTERNRRTP